ncbi:MAG: hypothetical protein HC802_20755 [Caldilineaceae bacterium]|nr:hypothetical protein [Caldilineaceae bacterium]
MVEAVMVLPELIPENLARFQLRLARIMREHGPTICEQWQVAYPQALEDATLAYVRRELRMLGLVEVISELQSTPRA